MSKVVRVEKEIGGRTLMLETGRIAKPASAAVLATYGESIVLATVGRAKPRPGLEFFRVQVDYREKGPGAGKVPGGGEEDHYRADAVLLAAAKADGKCDRRQPVVGIVIDACFKLASRA